ncbi:hypothetical protein [Borreliella garinii]
MDTDESFRLIFKAF